MKRVFVAESKGSEGHGKPQQVVMNKKSTQKSNETKCKQINKIIIINK